jgi:putative redox protein
MKATSVWIDGYRSVVDNGRGHSIIVDLPADRNGANTAPTAIELAAMSLAGCVTTIFKEVAVKRKFDFKALKVELDAEKPKEASTITKLTGNVEITTSAEEQEARTVFRLTLDICPVGILFERAGIKPEWQVTVRKQ